MNVWRKDMTIHILQATKLIFFLILAHFSLVIDQFVGAIQRHLNPSGLIACHLCGLQVFLTNDHTSPCCNAPRFISTTGALAVKQFIHSTHCIHPVHHLTFCSEVHQPLPISFYPSLILYIYVGMHAFV